MHKKRVTLEISSLSEKKEKLEKSENSQKRVTLEISNFEKKMKLEKFDISQTNGIVSDRREKFTEKLEISPRRSEIKHNKDLEKSGTELIIQSINEKRDKFQLENSQTNESLSGSQKKEFISPRYDFEKKDKSEKSEKSDKRDETRRRFQESHKKKHENSFPQISLKEKIEKYENLDKLDAVSPRVSNRKSENHKERLEKHV